MSNLAVYYRIWIRWQGVYHKGRFWDWFYSQNALLLRYKLLESFWLAYHLHGDDTQLYLSFKVKDAIVTNAKIYHCLLHVKDWMSKNILKLNDDKTEFLIVNDEHQNVTKFELLIGCVIINSSDLVRSLEVTFNTCLSMCNHINLVCEGLHHLTLLSCSIYRHFARRGICILRYIHSWQCVSQR